jgi:hypothetical protein
MSNDPVNPYAPPTADLAIKPGVGGLSPRAAMLKHEVAVRSVAMVFNIVAVLCLGTGILALRHGFLSEAVAVGAVILGPVAFIVEFGLRRFSAWARVAGLVFSVAVVFAAPILLPGAFFVVPTLANRQSRFICSRAYRELVAATPHLNFATSNVPRYFVMIMGAVITAIAWHGFPVR